jgi:hypothetical protein
MVYRRFTALPSSPPGHVCRLQNMTSTLELRQKICCRYGLVVMYYKMSIVIVKLLHIHDSRVSSSDFDR